MFRLENSPKHVAKPGLAADLGMRETPSDMFRLENSPKHVAKPGLAADLGMRQATSDMFRPKNNPKPVALHVCEKMGQRVTQSLSL